MAGFAARVGLSVVEHGLELEQVLVAGLGVLLVLGEELVGTVRELAGQARVAGLVHQEVAVAALGLLAVESERMLLGRVEAEEVPVAAVDGLLHLSLAVGHAAHASRASVGHAKKANTTPKRFLKEIRDCEGYQVGDKVSADVFEVGDIVDVTGTSKGKGFAGTIKRHGQSRGPMAHGSHYHRGPGSLGTMLPKRVLKGKKLPGHMGNVTVTVQNLEIIEVNPAENYILVSGNVPGAKNALVLIKSAIKNTVKKNPKEIISYEETVVDEVVEETPVVETAVEETTEETATETEE